MMREGGGKIFLYVRDVLLLAECLSKSHLYDCKLTEVDCFSNTYSVHLLQL